MDFIQLDIFNYFSKKVFRDKAKSIAKNAKMGAKNRAADKSLTFDTELTERARELLSEQGFAKYADKVHVFWSRRLRSGAGNARGQIGEIRINPRLRHFGHSEIERTFLHELAHLLVHCRSRGHKIRPHGKVWQKACEDLGLPNESRCHELNLKPRSKPRYLYYCDNCGRRFHRWRKSRRACACASCCKKYNGNRFTRKYLLKIRRL